ncbi:CdaR family transcriptional regulator [Mycobacterium sp. 852002-51057_SCH5723018]|uniref:PucR family transcriptional regulator n=1 Tax=Mycobacterium sp. 852002-51057_SCH5723018 TaxID=1834094 RepID=UPI0007FC4204|nr:PucR family transcriptional regulator [Mycobacterium sp. 852002-51057_SCH5723018]
MTGVTDTDVDRCVRQIAAGLQQRLGQVTATIQRHLEEEIPELREDTASIELLGASIGGNVDTVLHSLHYGIDVQRLEAPTAALEYARRLAQHGVPVHALVRAYRIGQRRLNELVFAEVQAADMKSPLRVGVLENMSATMFSYIDLISQHVVEVYEEERERWLENQNSIRAVRVREILAAKTPVDVDAASSTIRYPLRWHHLAVLLWYPQAGSNGNELARLQRFLRELGQAAGASAIPLFVAADGVSGWGWVPFRAAAPEAIEKVRKFAVAHADSPSVGIGSMAAGVAGFRRSHRKALAVRAVAATRDQPQPSVIAADDPGVSVAALLGGDIDDARAWVAEMLGELAVDDENEARLRETLHVFLSTSGSYKLAAARLNLHPNTVKYRVGRAIALRGRAIDADRLDVELALLLCHWYGSAVTQQRPN